MNRQLYQYHPSWGYTFIPGLRTRIMHESGGYLLSVNRAGFRSAHDFRAKNESGRPRVLLFGDSFSAGMGVSDTARYPELLERASDASVFNFSLPGTGTDQHYLVWKDFASTIEHDVVVLAVQVENIRRVNSRYRRFDDLFGNEMVLPKPYFELDQFGELKCGNYPVPKSPLSEEEMSEEQAAHIERGGRFELVRTFINKMGQPVKATIQKVIKPQPLPEYNDETGDDWILMKAVLEKWCGEIKAPKVILLLPLYHYVEDLADPTPYQERFQCFNDLPDTQVLDPLPFLMKYPEAERRAFRFPVDIHPTRSLHRALADYLEPELGKLLSST